MGAERQVTSCAPAPTVLVAAQKAPPSSAQGGQVICRLLLIPIGKADVFTDE